jgi:hypothetical protein
MSVPECDWKMALVCHDEAADEVGQGWSGSDPAALGNSAGVQKAVCTTVKGRWRVKPEMENQESKSRSSQHKSLSRSTTQRFYVSTPRLE